MNTLQIIELANKKVIYLTELSKDIQNISGNNSSDFMQVIQQRENLEQMILNCNFEIADYLKLLSHTEFTNKLNDIDIINQSTQYRTTEYQFNLMNELACKVLY